MRGLLLALLGTILSLGVFAQKYTDGFEDFEVGDGIVDKSPNWSYWRNFGPNVARQEIDVVDNQVHSGTKSIYLASNFNNGGPQNALLSFGAVHDIGEFHLEFWLYVDNRAGASFNIQGASQAGSKYTLNFSSDEQGNYELFDEEEVLKSGTVVQNQWVFIEIDADLTYNDWTFSIDGQEAATFESIENSVASLNLFPQNRQSYWIDDIHFNHIEYDYPDDNAALMDVTLEGGEIVGDTVSITAYIKNLGVNEINEMDLSYIYNNKVTTEKLSSLSIFTGVEHVVKFSEPLTLVGGADFVEIAISSVDGKIGDDNSDDNFIFRKLSFITPGRSKVVLMEELTSTFCGFCPQGIVSNRILEERYGEYYEGISMHIDDPMEPESIYSEGYFFSFTDEAPFGILNRTPKVDMHPDNVLPAFIKELSKPTSATFDIGAEFDEENNELLVSVDHKFHDATGDFWKIACILVEDSVTGTSVEYGQKNSYFRGFNGKMGGFEDLERTIPASDMVYRNVTRSIAPKFIGQQLEKVYTDTENYLENYSFSIDTSWNRDHLKMVAILIQDDGSINNAGVAHVKEAMENGYVDKDGGNTDNVEFDGVKKLLKVYPNPTNQLVNIEFIERVGPGTLEVLNAQGEVVASEQMRALEVGSKWSVDLSKFSKGLYLINYSSGNTTFSERVICQ